MVELDDLLPQEQPLDNLFHSAVDLTPEWNYIFGVTAADFAAAGLSISPEISNIHIPVIWNYLDGICAIGNGAKQLFFSGDDYHQYQNKVKGVLNIISGAQLLAVSYNPALAAALNLSGATALAGPAFAVAMAADLISASIDYHNALKESRFEGWLEEKLQEVAFYEKRIMGERQKVREGTTDKKFEEIQHHIQELERKRDFILDCIKSRSRFYCEYGDYFASSPKEFEILKKWLDKEIVIDPKKHKKIIEEFNKLKTPHAKENRIDHIKNMIDKYLATKNNPQFDKTLKEEATGMLHESSDRHDNDAAKNKVIQEGLLKKEKELRINLCFKSLSFVGMTLLAISPFVAAACPPAGLALFVIGSVITTGVAAYYLVKNAPKMARGAKAAAKKVKEKFTLFKEKLKSKPKEKDLTDDYDEIFNTKKNKFI